MTRHLFIRGVLAFWIALVAASASAQPNFGGVNATWSIGEVSHQLIASGGSGGPYTFTVLSGSLPPGVSLRTDVPPYFPTGASGLLGIATVSGVYRFDLRVRDGSGATRDALNNTLTITNFLIRENYGIADASVGVPYSPYTVTTLNAVGAVTFGDFNGFPPGVTMTSAGMISGTPTASGFYFMSFSATDTGTIPATKVFRTINIAVYDIRVNFDPQLPNATQNVSYATTVSASGGTPPYTWTSSGIPPGLTLDPSGTISGTPNFVGRWSFNLTVTDNKVPTHISRTVNASITTVGVPPVLPQINFGTFDDCTLGVPCSRTVSANNGGTAPMNWSSPNLPAGLVLKTGFGVTSSFISAGDGEVVGTAAALDTVSNPTIQISATDSATPSASATVVVPFHISELSEQDFNFTNPVSGVPYSRQLRIIGGRAPYSVSQIAGVIPPGLTLDSNGLLHGTPTDRGFYSITMKWLDADNRPLQSTLFLSVDAAGGGAATVQITTNANLGTLVPGGYGFTFNACCLPSYKWTQVGGSFPPGSTLSQAGVLNGTIPATGAFGPYTFTLRVEDPTNAANFAERQFTVVVTPISTVGSSTLPDANVGTFYTTPLIATGGVGALTYTLQPFNYAPPGMTLSSAGVLSGTPTASGQYGFSVDIRDTAGNLLPRFFRIFIYPAGGHAPLNLPLGPNLGGVAIGIRNFSLSATGGVGPYHYAMTPGAPTVPGMRVIDGPPLPSGTTTFTAFWIGVIPTAGTYNTSIRVTDSDSPPNVFDRAVTLSVIGHTITSAFGLPKATKDVFFSFQMTPFGGSGSYSWSISGLGAVASDLTINSLTGQISGTPHTAGTYNPTVGLKDLATNITINFGFSLVVDPFAITNAALLPQATAGVPYNLTFLAPGCTSPCTWTVTGFPTGVGLTFGSGGTITGTPTGTFVTSISVQASSAAGVVSKAFLIKGNTNPPIPLSVNPVNFGDSLVGNQVANTISPSFGTAPFTAVLLSGSLPPGVDLFSDGDLQRSGSIPGQPYLIGRTMVPGLYSFSLSITDAVGSTVTVPVMWRVTQLSFQNTATPPLTYLTSILPTPWLIVGGSGSYTWTSTALPPGLGLNAAGVLSGTPTTTGIFSSPVQVSDTDGNIATTNVSMTIGPTTVNFGPVGNLGSFQQGVAFTRVITPAGTTAGTPPYTVTPITPLPTWLRVLTGDALFSTVPAGSIVLAGTPPTAGTFEFTLRIDDSAGNFGVRTFTMTVVPLFTPTTGTLADGSVGVPYSQKLEAFGSGAVVWSLLPGSSLASAGLSLSPAGLLTGTPTAVGSFGFTAIATSSSTGASLSLGYSLRISSIAITDPVTLPVAVIGQPYSFTFHATGGGTSKIWFANGAPGTMFVSPDGVLSGNAPSSTAPFNILVTVNDGTSTVSKRFVLYLKTANPSQLSYPLTTTALPDLTAGQSLNFNLGNALIGGVAPYAWSALGSLPAGITLVSGSSLPPTMLPGSTLLLSGPLAAGDYAFDLAATDSVGSQIARHFTLHVSEINILSGVLRNPTAGLAYSQQLVAAAGTAPYTFTIEQSNTVVDMLPPGFLFSPSGLISGTTSSTGTFNFTVHLTDSLGRSIARSYSLTVSNAQGIRIANVNPPDTWVGNGRETELSVIANTFSTYTWSVVGVLPSGLSLVTNPDFVGSNSGVIAGTMAVPGTYTYTVRATDNANPSNFADHTFTSKFGSFQVVAPAGRLLGGDLPAAHVGSFYTTTIKVAGGTPPYSFGSSRFGPLPPGMSLSSDGILSGTPTAAGGFGITLVIADADGQTITTGVLLTITPPGVPAPLIPVSTDRVTELNPFPVGSPIADYSLVHIVRGGVPPFTFSLSAGSSLPPGVVLVSGSNGVPDSFGGIVTTSDEFNFSLDVHDAAGQTLTLPIGMEALPVVISPNSIPNGKVGSAYSQTMVPSAGIAPYTQGLFPGSDLMPGVAYSATGQFSGTPTYPGNYLVTPYAIDSSPTLNGNIKSLKVTIDNASGQAQGVAFSPRAINLTYMRTMPAPAAVSVSVNTTTGNAAFTLSMGGIPGVTLSTSGGTAPTSLSLTFGVTGLAPGTYSGVLGLSAPTAASLIDLIPVTLTVTDPPPCSYSLSSSVGSVPAVGGGGVFSVLTGSTCSWTALPSDPWITLTAVGSGAGSAGISFGVSANPGTTLRTGSIDVHGAVYSITQFGTTCGFTINPPVINATAAGGAASVKITASSSSCAWTASGLGVTPGSGTGTKTVSITIPANASPSTAMLSATIAGQTLTVNQSGVACTTMLSPYDAAYPAAGGSGSVGVSTLAACSYSTVPGPSWISITSGGSGGGPSGTLFYDVLPNTTTFARSGALSVGGQTFQVTQEPLACSVTVDTSGLGTPYGSAGGNGSIVVTTNGANCPWTASSGAPWLAISPGSGTGSATLNVIVTSNGSSVTGRMANLTVAGQTISVAQDGIACSYGLQSSNASAPASGGSGSVGVIAAAACGWTSVSNDPWLMITASGTSGSTNVQFAASPNPSSIPRTGSLTIAGLTYTVNQAGAACSFTTGSGPGIAVGEDGGTSTFSFSTATAGCSSPTAVSYAGWLGASTDFSGTSGTVTFNVPANPSNALRVGTIVVGDLTFTVTQLGAPCGYSLASYGAAFNSVGGSGNVYGSPSASLCAPVVGTTQPTMITLGMLSGPTLNIFTQPYSVAPFISLTNGVRKGTITFGGQIYTVKQTSW